MNLLNVESKCILIVFHKFPTKLRWIIELDGFGVDKKHSDYVMFRKFM